jgi:hypothetical protein
MLTLVPMSATRVPALPPFPKRFAVSFSKHYGLPWPYHMLPTSSIHFVPPWQTSETLRRRSGTWNHWMAHLLPRPKAARSRRNNAQWINAIIRQMCADAPARSALRGELRIVRVSVNVTYIGTFRKHASIHLTICNGNYTARIC